MKNLVSFFLFLALAAPQLAPAQRNVVLIIADDLGTDYLGFYEDFQDTAPMPNIRKLLSRGVRFTNAMSNPVCSPTRAGILTGRYSFRTGVGSVVGSMGDSDELDINELTIPLLLDTFLPDGIAKANFGKWHLHESITANLMNPNIMGYDHFEGIFVGELPDYFEWEELINGVPSDVMNYATTETTNDAIAWIGDQGTKPFFLWLAYNAPHSPYHLPPEELHSYTLPDTPSEIMANPKAYFKASLEALDHEIGRLFDSLEVHNLLDSTDIIFIGDNGNSTKTAQISSTDRAKGTIYQYGVHVPFVIAGPSVVDPGRTSEALVNTVDLFATILEMFGYADWPSQIPVSKPVDSKSILPILANLSENVRPWAFTEIFKKTSDANDGKAMRNKNFKLLHFDEDGHQELYRLSSDPDEADNLLAGTLTMQELNNYHYLCNQMTALVGTGSYCDSAIVATKDLEGAENSMTVYPNPFRSHIYVGATADVLYFELTDPIGKVVFSGKNIAQQDFSNLPPGVYFLKLMGERSKVFKLEKE
ncbi:MAG: sulfatase-like hydrolase/transferase [Saprospiraceae bacterium]